MVSDAPPKHLKFECFCEKICPQEEILLPDVSATAPKVKRRTAKLMFLQVGGKWIYIGHLVATLGCEILSAPKMTQN